MMGNIPEEAIQCFERWSRTQVVFYKYSPLFKSALGHKYEFHNYDFCCRKKQESGDRRCWLACGSVADEVWRFRSGGVKRCHHGIAEWFVPIFSGHQLLGLLCAGARRIEEGTVVALPFFDRCTGNSIMPGEFPPYDPDEAGHILEGLRQLAARLKEYHQESREAQPKEKELSRKDFILQLIAQSIDRNNLDFDLGKLAEKLYLSRSRTSHLVRELTGKSFQELQNDARLQRATSLLLVTDLAVGEIALRCGFLDSSGFFRFFRKHLHLSPEKYRDKHHK